MYGKDNFLSLLPLYLPFPRGIPAYLVTIFLLDSFASYCWSLKRFISISLCFCLVFQCVVQLGLIGLYRLNKGYIAKNLCENRAKPQLKCEGKCHLKKQLKKASREQDRETKPQQEELAAATFFVLPDIWRPQAFFTSAHISHSSYYAAPQGIVVSADIFHPPQQG
jgi:hypothetical protein